jgi:hypothetical protein
MTIVIMETRIDSGALQGVPDTRGVTLWISDGADNYITQRGGLPLTGDLLPQLQADEANIWIDAVAGGQVATAKENAKADRLIYMTNNPNAKAIFELSAADVETQVNALVDAIIPAATAANRTKLKRVLAVGILVNRESVAGE